MKTAAKHNDPLSKRQARSRDAGFWKVLNSALELDFRKGHMKWTMSELSRKSGITRSLIYYHFGRLKIQILNEAVDVIGEQLIGISEERMLLWQKGDWTKSMEATRQTLSQAPFLCNFYLIHRERPTEIGSAIRKLERAYLKKLEKFFPKLPPEGIKALFAFFFGMTFSPLVDTEAIGFGVGVLKNLTGTLDSNPRS
jgi:AcrR family transcriptional regulator